MARGAPRKKPDSVGQPAFSGSTKRWEDLQLKAYLAVEAGASDDDVQTAKDTARLSLLISRLELLQTLSIFKEEGEFSLPGHYELAANLVTIYREIARLQKQLGLKVMERSDTLRRSRFQTCAGRIEHD